MHSGKCFLLFQVTIIMETGGGCILCFVTILFRVAENILPVFGLIKFVLMLGIIPVGLHPFEH